MKLKRALLCLLVVATLFPLVGFGKGETSDDQKTDGSEVPTITIATSKDSAEWKIWPTDYVLKVEEALGINIETQRLTNEQHDLAIASGVATFDIANTNVIGTSADVQSMLESGFAIELDPYLEEYGQNILAYEDRNNLFREFKSNGTGKLYFKGIQTGMEPPPNQLWNGYIVRLDWYKELGYPEINNDDDYLNVLKQMVELHPTNDVGNPTYGLGNYNDNPWWSWTVMYEAGDNLATPLIGSYVDMNNDTIFAKYTDDRAPFWKSMAYLNKAYKMGLLDPDIFVMKSDDLKEKVLQGTYAGGLRTWEVNAYAGQQRDVDPNSLSQYFSIFPEDGGVAAWYGANPVGGWENNGWYVTESSENPELAVALLDYFDNPDALREFYSGAQGEFWDYDANNVPGLTEEALALRVAGGTPWDQTGLNGAETGGIFSNMSGSSGSTLHSDGGQFDLFADIRYISDTLNAAEKDFCEYFGVTYPAEVHVNQVKAGITHDRRNDPKDLFMVTVAPPEDMKLIETTLIGIAENNIVELVTAETEEEFNEIKERVLSDFVASGADELFAWAEAEYERANTMLQDAKKKYNID